jgi:hypothetical protein
MHKAIAALAVTLVTLCGSTALAATFINLASDDNQVTKATNQPVAITMGGAHAPGFKVAGSKLTIDAADDYFVVAAAQVGGTACR